MPPAQLHQTLVIMIAVRLPYALAAREPACQRYARINDKWREHERREPPGPIVLQPTNQTECTRQEAERHRTSVAHENARRMEIEYQKCRCRCRDTEIDERERVIAGKPRRNAIESETEQRHAAGEPVRTVHEIVEVRHPCQ